MKNFGRHLVKKCSFPLNMEVFGLPVLFCSALQNVNSTIDVLHFTEHIVHSVHFQTTSLKCKKKILPTLVVL